PAGARLLGARVDGRWLDRPAPDADGLLTLPVPVRPPGAGKDHRYEVHYETAAASGWLTSRLEAPAPALLEADAGQVAEAMRTLTPADLRRVWRLPPGVRPLYDSGWRGVPTPGSPADAGRRTPADLYRLVPAPRWAHRSEN